MCYLKSVEVKRCNTVATALPCMLYPRYNSSQYIAHYWYCTSGYCALLTLHFWILRTTDIALLNIAHYWYCTSVYCSLLTLHFRILRTIDIALLDIAHYWYCTLMILRTTDIALLYIAHYWYCTFVYCTLLREAYFLFVWPARRKTVFTIRLKLPEMWRKKLI